MLSAVNPTSNGFGGGSYTPAGRPTDVGGAFSSPGASAALPPGVPSSGIIEARNNKGSNVQIPYARLVPMHGNPTSKYQTDKRKLVCNGVPQYEYDGLHTGELAWILGRRMKGGGTEMTAPERFAHQAMGGIGNGVDRMQRLASTGWVEALFREKLGNAKINLHDLQVTNPFALKTDATIAQFQKYLAGASCLHVPDITWWRALLEGTDAAHKAVGHDPGIGRGNNSGRRKQGISVLSTGPFLRGTQADSKVVRFGERRVGDSTSPEDLPRNFGDSIAFSALEAELRKNNFMDWTPDGIVMSKLESPTDEPMKSTELDARQAQLFNVGVQGPSITTSWTSDLRDHRLEVQPMDKVFVCVVADLAYTVSDIGNNKYIELRKQHAQVLGAMQGYRRALKEGNKVKVDAGRAAVERAIERAKAAFVAYKDAIDSEEIVYETRLKEFENADMEYKQAEKDAKSDPSKQSIKESKMNALKQAKAALDALKNPASVDTVALMKTVYENVRQNSMSVNKATLSNFRLMRTTSSHMSNYSHYKPGDADSRLGLKLGELQVTDPAAATTLSGVSEVIVGGWCIGTVIDSAASRSTIGFQTVKSHPTTMAINLNVNVQWWSGDKLSKHFTDADGQVLRRGEKRKLNKVSGVTAEENDVFLSGKEKGDNRQDPQVQAQSGGHDLSKIKFIPPEEARDVSLDDDEKQTSKVGSSSAFSEAPKARAVLRRV